MNHIVDAHVAYCTAIADLSRDKTELLERIKRLEEENNAMRADLLLWKDWVEEERGKQ